MSLPFLSVIVPCYNIDLYIDKCVSSIVEQTYHHLEILLIDDGSTDETGKKCDAWKAKDSRITVIHKPNEGSSYARKTGVERASAQYVAFADADDWIDENMYTEMMAALLSTRSDIAQCGVCDVYEDGVTKHRSSKYEDSSFQIFGRTESVVRLMENKGWQSYMWNKIFKRELFDHIVFPKDMLYCEDFVIMHELFHQASQTVYLHKEYYFYYQRTGSICSTVDLPQKYKRKLDYSDAFYQRFLFVQQYPEYRDALLHVKSQVAVTGIRALTYLILYPQYCKKAYYLTKTEQIRAISFREKEKLPLMISIRLYLLKISPTLFKCMIILCSRIVMATNKLKITNKRALD